MGCAPIQCNYSACLAALLREPGSADVNKMLDNSKYKYQHRKKKVHVIGAQALHRNHGPRTERRDENNVEGQVTCFLFLISLYKPTPPEA